MRWSMKLLVSLVCGGGYERVDVLVDVSKEENLGSSSVGTHCEILWLFYEGLESEEDI